MDDPGDAPTRVALVGAGNIAGPYAQSLARHPELRLVGVHDVDGGRARDLAAATGCRAYASPAELADDGVDVAVNLTSAPHHFATTRELVRLGLDVFSEKPLALNAEEARELVALARATSVRVACAPSLWLGRSYQEVGARLREGELGAVRLVTAEVHQGRIETWHPSPAAFFRVGPVVDTGVYALAYVTATLGPVRRVQATSARLLPERTSSAGEAVETATDDAWLVSAVLGSGALLRLTCDFYVDAETVPRGVAFHGDRGSLRLLDLFAPDAAVERAVAGEPFVAEAPGDALELDWALGVLDLARARRRGRPHRLSVEHAGHVVDVLEAVGRSAATGAAVEVTSSFELPALDPPARRDDPLGTDGPLGADRPAGAGTGEEEGARPG
ncbi:Gfo/Idh/MocA family oxidoreductase [Pseudokineococcus basanitobsidens]|uniref:Gfo/Idh/MocA family oxidoreductase n=1 Tax=Pseudokineococcus basanitobsidens TaxID=1926649 RepID=A0ABU8RG98_9ACTN